MAVNEGDLQRVTALLSEAAPEQRAALFKQQCRVGGSVLVNVHTGLS